MKKIISLFLTLIMTFAVCSLVACKKDDGNGSQGGETGIEYELVKQTAEDGGNYYVVSGFNLSNEDADTIADGDYEEIMLDLVIPQTYEELPVKKIDAEAFVDQVIIKTVTIPATIEEIGAGAFSGCKNIEKITLPFIGQKANAINANKVFGYIFGTTSKDGCVEAKQTYNAGTDASATYYVPSALTEVVFTGETLSDYAFSGVTTLTKVSFTEEIEEISTGAFKGCTALNDFTIPSTVTVIKDYAFSGCTNLYTVDFASVEVIGEYAFETCTSLNTEVELVFPSSLTTIKERAFKGCTGIIGLDFSVSKVEFIGESAFNGCIAIKFANFNNKTVTIQIQAFVGCDKLTKDSITNLKMNNVDANAFPYGTFNN